MEEREGEKEDRGKWKEKHKGGSHSRGREEKIDVILSSDYQHAQRFLKEMSLIQMVLFIRFSLRKTPCCKFSS